MCEKLGNTYLWTNIYIYRGGSAGRRATIDCPFIAKPDPFSVSPMAFPPDSIAKKRTK